MVDTITTSSDGFVKSKELYLGKYEVKEITAPYGMVVSGETHTVEPVSYTHLDVYKRQGGVPGRG